MGVPAHAGGSAGRGLTLHPGRPSGVLTKDVDMKPLRKPIRSQAAPSSPQDAAALAASTMAALGDILIAGGQCDARALDRSRRVAAETGDRLDSVLVQLGLVSEAALARAYGALLDLPLALADSYPHTALFPETLAPRFLRHARALPIAVRDDVLTLAIADPLNRFAPAAIAAAVGMKVTLAVALPIELEAAFDRLYPDAVETPAAREAEHDTLDRDEDDVERLKDLASVAPVIRLVNQIIARAVETQASDIHLEPFEDRLRIRYRQDGILNELDSQPARLASAIISRIKIVAGLDIAERRLPQDGRIKLAVRGQDIDLRVSTMPSLHGENVVLRILDRQTVALDYQALGLPAEVVRQLDRSLHTPNGIVLVTGPTGSGKTTTLYTGILAMNAVERKIATVEDPIEYQIPGITQTQVKPGIGLTFASVLRSTLRQDPDIAMIGEIRDLETAEIAVQGALTGRLVLSTLHTNSAAASITRLRDMGLQDYLIASVLRGVLAQRLVRRLCADCREQRPAPDELVERYGLRRGGATGPVMLWHPVGCPACRQTGYRGRQAIGEFLTPDENIERLIFARADQTDIERAAVAGGMVTMFDAGIEAALAGDTTIAEVLRSLRGDA
jgi:general secretion pathway protein E